MHAARRAGKASFSYKSNTYKRSKTKTGLIVYKKVGGGAVRSGGKAKGGAVRSGGSMATGGAMTASGRTAQRYGKAATTFARKAANSIETHGPALMANAATLGLVGGRVGRRKRRKRKY